VLKTGGQRPSQALGEKGKRVRRFERIHLGRKRKRLYQESSREREKQPRMDEEKNRGFTNFLIFHRPWGEARKRGRSELKKKQKSSVMGGISFETVRKKTPVF